MKESMKLVGRGLVFAAVIGARIPIVRAAVPVATVDLPRDSPAARVYQQVGLTDIEVEYGSPAVKGRSIWGDVVPFDKLWPISASQPPKIRFSRDVEVAGKPLVAGLYRLSAVPGKREWTFVFDPILDANKPNAKTVSEPVRIKARAQAAPAREHLAFLFADFDDDHATLDLDWAKLRVSIPILTNTTKQVLAGIEALDDAWRSYANAARFMLETRKDYDTGLRYADRSLALKDDWYTHWIKAALLAAKHDYKSAAAEGERAHELGEKLSDAFTLEPELRRAIADWKKRF